MKLELGHGEKIRIVNPPESRHFARETMSLRTDHLARCIQTLQPSLARLAVAAPGSIDYEIYRNAVVKGCALALVPGFIADAQTLEQIPREKLGHAGA